ncbi:hypothetical protein JCM10213_000465 [Rhodosporidiobolus nylandii]
MSFSPEQVKRRTCCGCIPARWAVMLLSLIAATISAMQGIEATIRLFSDGHLNPFAIWLNVAQMVLFFSLCLIGLYGWSGCVMQKFEWWHLCFSVVLGINALIMLNLPASKQLATAICLRTTLNAANFAQNNMNDPSPALDALAAASQACTAHVKTGLLLLDFCWVIGVLVELYLVLVIAHYLDELQDIEAAQLYGVDIESPNPPYRFAEVEQPLVQAQLGKQGKRGRSRI